MSDENQVQVEAAATPPAEAAPASPPPKAKPPFSVGEVLSTSMRITRHNFVPFFVLACVLQLPTLAVWASGGTKPDTLTLLLVQTLVNALTQAVVAYGTIMELQGSRPSMRACVGTGLRQLGRVLGVTLISGLAIGGAMLLLVVPGIIVTLMLYVVVPVTLVESLGIDAAMRRSRKLTYGYKGDIFLIVLFAGAVGFALELFIYPKLGHSRLIVRELLSGLTTMFFAVTVAVTYIELRKRQDGLEVPDLATAFARIRK